MGKWRWSRVGIMVAGFWVCGSAPPPGGAKVSLTYANASCNPEKSWSCLCVGSPGDASAPLQEIGVDLEALKKEGWPCVKGDFDRDGQADFAFPGKDYSCNGGVPVRVLFTRNGEVRDVSALPREVSCLQLYGIRSRKGPHGTPPTKR
ncbi:hypothetical protein LY474_23275 [Myxococcus stipitatus]|uniref:hypothetical protein n=1 Tax=Myxococcus stipitatus TaxID=83455 RepID=UPI001F3171A1|nr:hypothetical protein [Myxococcus stipitatus]MCE9670734.1 hypothetical protein [Myxococcus stipitatus]